jgi:hypothetical protein
MMVPPVPIPNTEVKRHSANGSACIACARVGRCQYYAPFLGNKERGFFCTDTVGDDLAVRGEPDLFSSLRD